VCIDILFMLSVVANLINCNSVLNLFACSAYPLVRFFFALFLRFAGGECVECAGVVFCLSA